MRKIWLALVCLLVGILSGCTTISRVTHLYGSEALPAQTFHYADGGASAYYVFEQGKPERADAAIFFYGATGCPSWKSVMPEYVSGLQIDARIFALNKRFVADRSTGLFDCGRAFDEINTPGRWEADFKEFIEAQVRAMPTRPKRIVVVGVSEAAWAAAAVAAYSPLVTDLAIIGSGGYSMRQSLGVLKQRGAILFDVEAGWRQISADPRSIEKSWYGNRYRWWSDTMDLDPMQNLLKLNIPILLGIGERDESVPVESAYYLAEQFKQAGKTNLTLRIYPGADHRLNADGRTYRNDFFYELACRLQPSVCGVYE